MSDNILTDTFRGGDYVLGVLAWVLTLLIVAIIVIGICSLGKEYLWYQTEPFEHNATLLSLGHKSSTQKTSIVNTVGANGTFGVGSVVTGEPEKFVTVWDCGEYGRLIADDEEIFRWAKPESTLLLKKRGNEVKIWRIKS